MKAEQARSAPPALARAVILAGGRKRGTPSTSVLPEPLMPIGNRAILELVVDQVSDCGIDDVTFCVGNLSHLIRAVLRGRENGHVRIRYVQEQKALGTAGALRLVDGFDTTLVVLNGDVLTDIDYADLIEYHREHDNALTVATHRRRIKIDHGVVRLDGEPAPGITGLDENPEILSTVSMGIYVVDPPVLNYIPKDRPFELPDLVQALLGDEQRVGAYLHDGLWFEIGREEDYEQAVAAWSSRDGNQAANGRHSSPSTYETARFETPRPTSRR